MVAVFLSNKAKAVDALVTTPGAGRPCFVGFDLGTSGARISIVEQQRGDSSTSNLLEVFSDSIPWKAYDDQEAWEQAVYTLLDSAKTAMADTTVMANVKSICVSGTSASCLLVDKDGTMSRAAPRMYDYDVTSPENNSECGAQALALLDKHAPQQHTARAKTSSLAKLVTWILEKPLDGDYLCHQSDYIAMKLAGKSGSDEVGPAICGDHHNVLKCGYDVRKLEWPTWVKDCLDEAAGGDSAANDVLPSRVVSPGEPFGTVGPDVASRFGLSNVGVALVGGTTDSNAAFFAATAKSRMEMGTAVTSLGSTMAMKQLSSTYVEDASRGVYSHRFPNYFNSNKDDDDSATETWLIGGASNVGCAVLRQQAFSDEELVALSKEIDPQTDIANLSYYPLTKQGERFPVADSDKEPMLTPVPDSRRDYLHGILQGIANVERDGFVVLGELGATPSHPTTVMTCGGGAKNDMWTAMRERKLKEAFCDRNGDDTGISVQRAKNTEASYGAAVLAAATFI